MEQIRGAYTSDKIHGVLKNIFLFKNTRPEMIEDVLQDPGLNIKRYAAGKTIYEPLKFEKSLGVILSGIATACSPGGRGKALLKTLREGSVFGAASLFGGGDVYIALITAKSTADALFLSQALVSRVIESDSAAALNYITFLSERIRFLNGKISGFTAGSVEERLAKYLLELPRDGDGEATIPVSYKMLADMLDIGRASLYRALSSFEENMIIKRDERKIKILSLDKLRLIF